METLMVNQKALDLKEVEELFLKERENEMKQLVGRVVEDETKIEVYKHSYKRYELMFEPTSANSLTTNSLIPWDNIHYEFEKEEAVHSVSEEDWKYLLKNGFGINKCTITHERGKVKSVKCTGLHPNVDPKTGDTCIPDLHNLQMDNTTLRYIIVCLMNPNYTYCSNKHDMKQMDLIEKILTPDDDR